MAKYRFAATERYAVFTVHGARCGVSDRDQPGHSILSGYAALARQVGLGVDGLEAEQAAEASLGWCERTDLRWLLVFECSIASIRHRCQPLVRRRPASPRRPH
jgi:hypothetical protein